MKAEGAVRIAGRELGSGFTKRVELRREGGEAVGLTIAPLGLGFHRRLRERGIVAPVPPTRIARDSARKPLRGERGMAMLVADEYDREYLAEVELYHQRVAVLVVAEALKGDPAVELETQEPGPEGNWRAYADALHAEFERSGWTAGDLIRLCQEVCRLSNLLDEHLQEAHGNFSPAAGGG